MLSSAELKCSLILMGMHIPTTKLDPRWEWLLRYKKFYVLSITEGKFYARG